MNFSDNPYISDEEILYLLLNGTYRVDLAEGKIYGKNGIEITQEASGKNNEYVSVRIKTRRLRRKIQVSTLVWMAGTQSTKPNGWQIHHFDEDTSHNAFDNLICLHPTDHRKYHKTQDLPF